MDDQNNYPSMAKAVIDSFSKRQMEGYYCATKEEAVDKALELMKPGSSVGWGGSATLKEIGLINKILNEDYLVFDRDAGRSHEEKWDIYSNILKADYFLMSSNAVTFDGELINVDGRSDRIAFLCFGPKNVIVIVGMNKLAPDTKSGIKRAREIAGPKNGMKLHRDIPCAKTGRCSDCYSPESICSQILITRRSAYKGRIKVILVGEELGF